MIPIHILFTVKHKSKSADIFFPANLNPIENNSVVLLETTIPKIL